MRPASLLLIPAFALAATAQNNAAKPGTGTVTGHVYCADTNAPARMARVQLEPVKEAEQRSGVDAHATSSEPVGGVVETTLDGSFVIPDVPRGSYYVVVAAAGYLSPRVFDEDIDDAEPPPPAGQPPIVVPRVDVAADQSAGIDVRLERGAAVSGTIRFDDGSPASGVMFVLLHKSKDKWIPSQGSPIAMTVSPITDDLGRYRVGGLRNRDYIVQAILSHMDLVSAGRGGLSGTLRSSLILYSGDVTRISAAIPFKLGPGEDRTGEDITIPLSKLHSISGVVTAARDGHAVNGGNLDIRFPEENETVAEAEIGNDGTFHFEGVSEGSYTLRVLNAQDKQIEQLKAPGNTTIDIDKTLHQYGELEQTIKVEGDIPNLVLAVPEQTKQHTASQ